MEEFLLHDMGQPQKLEYKIKHLKKLSYPYNANKTQFKHDSLMNITPHTNKLDKKKLKIESSLSFPCLNFEISLRLSTFIHT